MVAPLQRKFSKEGPTIVSTCRCETLTPLSVLGRSGRQGDFGWLARSALRDKSQPPHQSHLTRHVTAFDFAILFSFSFQTLLPAYYNTRLALGDCNRCSLLIVPGYCLYDDGLLYQTLFESFSIPTSGVGMAFFPMTYTFQDPNFLRHSVDVLRKKLLQCLLLFLCVFQTAALSEFEQRRRQTSEIHLR